MGTETLWTRARQPRFRRASTWARVAFPLALFAALQQAQGLHSIRAGFQEGARMGGEWGFLRGVLSSLWALPQSLNAAQLHAVSSSSACCLCWALT